MKEEITHFKLALEIVWKFDIFRLLGAFTPVIMEGNIFVDGVLASCYASYDHTLAHSAMTPIRWFPRITEWIFGRESESLVFANISKNLGKWLLPTLNYI